MGSGELVASVKAALEAAGKDLSGPCGAFAIVQGVASKLAAEKAGYLSKPAGNNCDGKATDIICYPDGHIFDILGDGGGANTPQWNDAGMVDPARYVPGATEPPPDVPPPAPPGDLGDLGTRFDRLEAKLDALLAAVSVKLTPPAYVGKIFGVTVVLRPSN